MEGVKSLFKSRKFWLTVCAVALPLLEERFGLKIPVETTVAAIMSIVVLVGSIAYEDGKKGASESGAAPAAPSDPNEPKWWE